MKAAHGLFQGVGKNIKKEVEENKTMCQLNNSLYYIANQLPEW